MSEQPLDRDRRRFLKSSLLAAGTAALGPALAAAAAPDEKKSAATGTIPTRPFGKTGRVLPILGMGGSAMVEKWVALPANPLAHPTVIREMPPRKVLTGKRPIIVELEHMQTMLLCPEVPAHRRVRHLVMVCQGFTEGELAGRVWSDRKRGPRGTIDVGSMTGTWVLFYKPLNVATNI